jgi:hypothetical protein
MNDFVFLAFQDELEKISNIFSAMSTSKGLKGLGGAFKANKSLHVPLLGGKIRSGLGSPAAKIRSTAGKLRGAAPPPIPKLKLPSASRPGQSGLSKLTPITGNTSTRLV